LLCISHVTRKMQLNRSITQGIITAVMIISAGANQSWLGLNPELNETK